MFFGGCGLWFFISFVYNKNTPSGVAVDFPEHQNLGSSNDDRAPWSAIASTHLAINAGNIERLFCWGFFDCRV